MIRSFLAFELPQEIRGILARVSEEMKGFGLDLRWVPVENIHVTVVFLGEVSPDVVDPIGMEAEKVCGRFAPFEVTLKGSGVFPGRRRPNVLWVGLEGEIERMNSFRNRLQEALLPFGIKEEKRGFKPHLTLARFRKFVGEGKRLDGLLEKFGGLTGPTWRFNELVLFRSDLKPSGAVYTVLKEWQLAGEE